METSRIRYQANDLSISNPQPSAITGYTVLRASKGTTRPHFVSKGDVNTLLDLFGAPTAVINGTTYNYYGIQEAIDFINNGYGLWVSAPAGIHAGSTSNFGGVYVTTEGSLEPFNSTVGELGDGTPNFDYNITTSITCPSASFSAGFTASGGSPFVNTVKLSAVSPTGIILDNIPNKYFVSANVSSLTLTGVGTQAFSYTLGYTGGVWKFITGPGTFASNTIGTVSTGTNSTLNAPTSKITFLAPSSDPNCPLITAAAIATTLAGDTSITASWIQSIQSFVIMAFYQSSMRGIPGTFTMSNMSNMLIPVIITGNGGIATITQTLVNPTTLTLQIGTVTPPSSTSYVTIGTFSPIAITNTDTQTTIAALIAALPWANSGFIASYNGSGLVTITGTSPVDYAPWSNPSFNTVQISYNEYQYGTTQATTFTPNSVVSTDPNAKNGSGTSIFVTDVIGTNNYLRPLTTNLQFYNTSSGITWPNSITVTLQGSRILSTASFVSSTDLTPTLQPGWDNIINDTYADVMVAFDPEYCTALAPSFSGYRSSNLKFTTFLTSPRISNGLPASRSDNQAATNAYLAARATLPNDSGLAYYCNEMYVQENYTGTKFYATPIGSLAAMLAKIMDTAQGGLAPFFTNDSQGRGGQVNKTVLKQKFAFDPGMLDQLDAAGINPFVFDQMFGVMVTSQRTAASTAQLTDYSYLGHTMSFDLFRKEMRNVVMFPQIGKPISGTYIQLRTDQSNIILNKRLTGVNAIWTDGKIFIKEVNTSDTLAQNTFVIKARVKVTPFSEFVLLIFENVGQTSNV